MLLQHPSTLWRCLVAIPMLVVMGLMGTVYVGFAASFCAPAVIGSAGNVWERDGRTSAGARLVMLLILSVFHAIFGLMAVSYARTVFSDPGGVPRWWSVEQERRLDAMQAECARAREEGRPAEEPQTSEFRWCRKCNKFKPARAHHCSVCNRCVLKMDHHCPWVANCVGFANYKYFLCFLFWVLVGCVFVSGVMASELTAFLHMSKGGSSTYRPHLIEGSVMVLCISFAISMLLFAGMHGFLVLRGQTTLEVQTGARWAAGRSAYANVCDVMGPNPWLWFVPVGAPARGDGLRWGFLRFSDAEEEDEADTAQEGTPTGERLLAEGAMSSQV